MLAIVCTDARGVNTEGGEALGYSFGNGGDGWDAAQGEAVEERVEAEGAGADGPVVARGYLLRRALVCAPAVEIGFVAVGVQDVNSLFAEKVCERRGQTEVDAAIARESLRL